MEQEQKRRKKFESGEMEKAGKQKKAGNWNQSGKTEKPDSSMRRGRVAGGEKPGTQKPGMQKPGMQKSETQKPGTQKPETQKSGTQKPETQGKRGKISGSVYRCPAGSKCGGCDYLHLTYQEQLARKQKQVEELLKPFCRVHPVSGMEDPLHYRNKVHAVFDRTRGGKIISGIYQEGTHQVIPVESCLIENEKADAIISDIRKLIPSFKIKTYDEDTGYGLLRHVLIRAGHATGQIMVVLVLSSPILPSKNNFLKALLSLHPEITTVILNINDKRTSMVLGEKERVLYGKGYIEDELCGKRFRISSRSFYQVNSVQTEKLYQKAVELAGLTGKERAIDAYCGIGTIGILAASRAGEVIGVELNGDAVRDAVKNAAANQVKNISFYQNDAGIFLTGMAENKESADVVFMDPPRAGSTEAFISAVAAMAPKRVVYISCNPETLARDLKLFEERGYRAQGAWPYDMFPLTGHVESVVLLSRNEETKRAVYN